MNSIHDMGGMEGYGPINPNPNEKIFHYEWEQRVFGWFFCLFAGGQINVDSFRHAMERMGNLHYLEGSYYEHWLESFQTLLDESGVVTKEELEKRMEELRAEAN